jgi:hypothetical protein
MAYDYRSWRWAQRRATRTRPPPARAPSGDGGELPPRGAVAFISRCGGAGDRTLALWLFGDGGEDIADAGVATPGCAGSGTPVTDNDGSDHAEVQVAVVRVDAGAGEGAGEGRALRELVLPDEITRHAGNFVDDRIHVAEGDGGASLDPEDCRREAVAGGLDFRLCTLARRRLVTGTAACVDGRAAAEASEPAGSATIPASRPRGRRPRPLSRWCERGTSSDMAG